MNTPTLILGASLLLFFGGVGYLLWKAIVAENAARKTPPPRDTSHVTFDVNGVASVDPAYLLRQPHVQEQFKAGRRIVERERARRGR